MYQWEASLLFPLNTEKDFALFIQRSLSLSSVKFPFFQSLLPTLESI